MKRDAVLVALAVTSVVATLSSRALAQGQPLPSLPPSPSPSQSQPPPPPPPPAPPAPPPMVDATDVPPGVTTVYTPPPPPYVLPPPAAPCGGPGAYEHDGFYLRVSGGFGGLGLSGSGPAGSAKLSGPASNVDLAIGGTPSRGFVVGGAIAVSSIHGADLTGSAPIVTHGWDGAAGALAAFVDWFPDEHRGWHVGGMLGIGVVTLQNTAAQVSWTGGSLGGSAFGGYDFWLGPEWSLGLQGTVGGVGKADLKDGNQNSSGYTLGGFWGGIEATLLYH